MLWLLADLHWLSFCGQLWGAVSKLGSFEHCLNRQSGWNSSCTGHDTGLPEGNHTGRVKCWVSWKKVASVVTKRMSPLLSLTNVGVDILHWDVAFCTQKHQRNESLSRKGHLFWLDMSGWSTNFTSLDSPLVCYCASFSRMDSRLWQLPSLPLWGNFWKREPLTFPHRSRTSTSVDQRNLQSGCWVMECSHMMKTSILRSSRVEA